MLVRGPNFAHPSSNNYMFSDITPQEANSCTTPPRRNSDFRLDRQFTPRFLEALRVVGRRVGGRCEERRTPHPITRSGKASSFACSRAAARRAPDARQMRVSLAYSRVCSRSVDLDGAVDLEYKPPRGEEADGACGEREQR